MSICFIYHQDERHRVEAFANAFSKHGFDVLLAPVGWPVGSDEWWLQVRKSIEQSTGCVAFFSKVANSDKYFLERCSEAKSKQYFIPIRLDETPMPADIVRMQYIDVSQGSDVATAVERIAHYLPRESRKVSCFISYSRADVSVAQQLEAQLATTGIACWRDEKNIRGGSAWDQSIENAIVDCSHVLALVSDKSISSQNVADEISYARERGKIIIPLMLDETALPMRMHRAQAIDLKKDLEAGIKQLISQLGDYRQNQSAPLASSQPLSGTEVTATAKKASMLDRILRAFRTN